MRKTRKESQQETRQRLIAAAHAAIVRDGVGTLSLRRLCEDAGYSQGAFYSNFASRDELLLAVMEAHVHEEAQFLQHLLALGQDDPLEQVLGTLARRLADLARESQWSLLSIELQLHAQRDATFALAYHAARAGYHAAFAGLVQTICRHHGLEPALPPLQIAIGLYALWCGLAAQGTVPGTQPRDEIFLAFLKGVIGAP